MIRTLNPSSTRLLADQGSQESLLKPSPSHHPTKGNRTHLNPSIPSLNLLDNPNAYGKDNCLTVFRESQSAIVLIFLYSFIHVAGGHPGQSSVQFLLLLSSPHGLLSSPFWLLSFSLFSHFPPFSIPLSPDEDRSNLSKICVFMHFSCCLPSFK